MIWLRLSLTGLLLSVSLSSAALVGSGNHLKYWCGGRATDEIFRMGVCLGYVKGVADNGKHWPGDAAITAAQDELNALILFKSDMGAYQRLYTFLSQIFDYGNTAIEKRAIFYKRLLPLLEFGREREGIDLSKVVLIPTCADNDP